MLYMGFGALFVEYRVADEDKLDDKDMTAEQRKAVDLLYEAMIFWHGEGLKIIKRLGYVLNNEGLGREAANLAKIWKGVDDRWIEIAGMIAPYQSSKLSNIVIDKKVLHRFVIEAPRVIQDKREWLSKVKEDQAALPKPSIITQMNGYDDTMDEAEYIDVNAD